MNNNFFSISKNILDKIFQNIPFPADSLSLYLLLHHLPYTQNQTHIHIKIENKEITKIFGWSKKRVIKTKRNLKELGLINIRYIKNQQNNKIEQIIIIKHNKE